MITILCNSEHLTVMPNFMIQDQKWNSLNFLESENMKTNFFCI